MRRTGIGWAGAAAFVGATLAGGGALEAAFQETESWTIASLDAVERAGALADRVGGWLGGADGVTEPAAGAAPRSVLPASVWPGPSVAPAVAPMAGFGEPWSAALRSNAAGAGARPASSERAGEAEAACAGGAIGTARTVALETRGGPHWGRHDRYLAPDFLGPKEVVLTFDDGPRPGATRRILKTLDEHCVKATFFVIGAAAKRHPDILRETADAGHTIASHTATHPIPFDKIGHQAAMREIEAGYAQVSEALGRPIAPFFRFPGLAYTRELMKDLGGRDVSAFSVDVISDDTARGATADTIVENTMQRLRRYGNGILLFHDTLNRTADALPRILARLKAEGYRIVHLEPAEPRLAFDPAAERGVVQLISSAPIAGAPQAAGLAAPAAAPFAWGRTTYRRPAWRALEADTTPAHY